MRKSELTESMARKARLSYEQAEAALNAFAQTVTEALLEGESVQIPGFGVFEKHSISARMARNPVTGASIRIPAGKKPAFRFCEALKKKIGSVNHEQKGN